MTTHPRHRLTSWIHDEEGSAQSLMLTLIVPVFILAFGIILVDFGAKNSAESQATAAAQSVARIATSAGAEDYGVINKDRMISEGNQALRALGMTGSVTVDDTTRTVTVRACKSEATKFASAVGVPEVKACSEARARMYTLGDNGQKVEIS